MSIEVNNESGVEVDDEALVRLGRHVLERLYVHPESELSIILVDVDAMEKLHIEWMDEPGPTDVLSFPMDELRPGTATRPTAAGILGDVVLCPEVARTQADNAGHSMHEELLLLATHGMLHLLGFDHAEPEEEKEMFGLQRRLLTDFLAASPPGKPLSEHAHRTEAVPPMTVLLLALMAIVFVLIAALVTAAEAAFSYLPRQDAEVHLHGPMGEPVRRILESPVAHMHALRSWRVWFEMAAAVAVALLFADVLDNIWIAGLLATVTMAGLGFVLVGVSPRQLGRTHAATLVPVTARMVGLLRSVLGPIPRWLVGIGSALSPGSARAEAAFFTEEEFRELLSRANEAEMIEDSEAELIHSVFELGDTKVRSVMVPRTDMVSIEAGSTLRQAMSLFLRSGYSRVPVIGDNADDVRGILYLKDVVAVLNGQNHSDRDPVDGVCRDVRYVPESKPVGDFLQELQRESTHVAIVIDEYGGTAGLVTLEDLIEEIVGEIVDEYDSEVPEMEQLPEGGFRVSARMSIDDLGELFDLDLEDDEVDTVGGLLAKTLGRVPIVGSEVQVGDIALRAERVEGRRNRVSHILAWKVERPTRQDAHTDQDSEGSRETVENK